MEKNKSVKVTFKKQAKNTGLYAVGTPYNPTDMKINKKIFGKIIPPAWNSKNKGWIVKIRIIKNDINEDKNPNCIWRWVTAKLEFEKEELGRIWIQENIQDIMNKYSLYFTDDD